MVHGSFRFFSGVLGRMTGFHVILPRPQSLFARTDRRDAPKEKKCLWFFHGAGDCGEDVLLHTHIGDLADEHDLIVVLPDLENSFCLDSDGYMRYERYLTEELVPWTRELFPVSPRREDWLLGGISMGGYGAARLSLLHPEDWSRVFCLSGALDLRYALRFCKVCEIGLPQGLQARPDFSAHPDWDLFALLESSVPAGQSYYLDCGRGDILHDSSAAFAQAAARRGFPAVLREAEGNHDWDYWRKRLPSAVFWAVNGEVLPE